MFKSKFVKRAAIALLAIAILMLIIKKKEMTWRQSLLKAFYPVLMTTGKLFASKNNLIENKKNIQPMQSFYSLEATANNGIKINFNQFKGKKVLLVNTASDCGYTDQYAQLEKLYEVHKNNLVVIGFPANDFKNQEKGTDKEIAQFCKNNYGITFPLIIKSSVIKGPDQNQVFQWLTEKEKNGWNEQQPVWNFSKYLVNENGILTNFFPPSVSPLGDEVLNAINK